MIFVWRGEHNVKLKGPSNLSIHVIGSSIICVTIWICQQLFVDTPLGFKREHCHNKISKQKILRSNLAEENTSNIYAIIL